MSNKIIKKNKGFTLVELMVSMSIFMIVVLMALGALMVVSSTSKKSHAIHQSMDNVNFAMESMTRSLRMGTNYYCTSGGVVFPDSVITSNCVNGSIIVFTPQDPPGETKQTTAYFFDSTEHSLKKCTTTSGCISITSSNVYVENVRFFVHGAQLPSVGEYDQPGIYIAMKGRVTSGKETAEFAIQTMVSQRSAE